MACRRVTSTVVGFVAKSGRSLPSAEIFSSATPGRLSTVTKQAPFSIGSCRWFSGSTNGSMESSKFLFDKLSDENKDVVRLINLMLVEQVKKMNQDLESPQMVLLKKVHDEQKDTTRALIGFLFGFGCVFVCIENASYNVKIQSLQMVDNLASNSEEIVHDLVKAVIHGVNKPKIFGVGKPFVWQHKWLQEKKAKAVPELGNKEDVKTGKKEEVPVKVEAASWQWWPKKGPQPPVQVEVEAVTEPGKTEDLKTGKMEEAPVEVEAASWRWWHNKGPQPPVQVEVEVVPEPAKKEDLKTGKEEEAPVEVEVASWLWWRNKGPQPPVKVEVEAVPEPGKEEDLKTGKKEDVEE